MTTQKINGVYCVSDALGGGMKNVSRPRAEAQSMNGEVSVFELNKPQPYEVFSSWPEDVQKEYLKKLYWTHGASFKKIGNLFGFSDVGVRHWFTKMGIPTREPGGSFRDKAENAKKWDAFLRGGKLIKDIIPEETKQQLKEMTSITCKEPPKQEEKQVVLSNLEKELPVLFPAPPTTLTDINLTHISTIANAMYHIAHISDESLRNALAAELACWIWTDDAEHLKEDMKNIRRRILRDVHPEGGKA